MTLLQAIGPVPAWHRDAACGFLGKLFASKAPGDIAEQKKVCKTCPVRAECGAHAASMGRSELPDLVMAGLTKKKILSGGLVDGERECAGCAEAKTLEQFPKIKNRPGGRGLKCKDCVNTQSRAAHAARKAAAVAL